MQERTVRWNIKVSKEAWRVFRRTVQDIKARNAHTDPDELQLIVDEAVREVRAERRTKGRDGRA